MLLISIIDRVKRDHFNILMAVDDSSVIFLNSYHTTWSIVLRGCWSNQIKNYRHYSHTKISELTEWNKKSFYRIKVGAKLGSNAVDFT